MKSVRASSSRVRTWGVVGLVAQVLFLASWLVASSWQGPDYSPLAHSISDMYAVTAPHAWLLVLCLTLCGIGTALFALLGLRPALQDAGGNATVGSLLLALSILGLGDLFTPFERLACRLADPGCSVGRSAVEYRRQARRWFEHRHAARHDRRLPFPGRGDAAHCGVGAILLGRKHCRYRHRRGPGCHWPVRWCRPGWSVRATTRRGGGGRCRRVGDRHHRPEVGVPIFVGLAAAAGQPRLTLLICNEFVCTDRCAENEPTSASGHNARRTIWLVGMKMLLTTINTTFWRTATPGCPSLAVMTGRSPMIGSVIRAVHDLDVVLIEVVVCGQEIPHQ